MNKYIKHLIALVLLGLSCSVYAEGNCPSGYYPIGDANAPGCAPIPEAENQQSSYQQAVPSPPVPTGEWESKWGSIATDGVKGIIGAATDKNSEKIAADEALRQCRNKGGDPCKIQTTYSNQCAALVTGDKLFNVKLGTSENEASKQGMLKCSSEDVNCRVYYSGCSKPRFVKY